MPGTSCHLCQAQRNNPHDPFQDKLPSTAQAFGWTAAQTVDQSLGRCSSSWSLAFHLHCLPRHFCAQLIQGCTQSIFRRSSSTPSCPFHIRIRKQRCWELLTCVLGVGFSNYDPLTDDLYLNATRIISPGERIAALVDDNGCNTVKSTSWIAASVPTLRGRGQILI